jgi:hypothetical protein
MKEVRPGAEARSSKRAREGAEVRGKLGYVVGRMVDGRLLVTSKARR